MWGQQEQQAMELLKQALVSKPVLCPPDPTKGYILQTDASRVALSAILAQKDAQDRERVVAYASKKLLPRERLYSVIELETYAGDICSDNRFNEIRPLCIWSQHRITE